MSFDNIVSQIQAGQADVGVSGFTYSKKRKVDWSTPYTATAQVAVVNKDSKINSLKDLQGKKLAAQSGSTGEQAAKSVKNAKVSSVSNVQEIFSALTAKQYDAVIVDLAVANNYAKAQNFKVLSQSLLDEKNYIITKQGNTTTMKLINKALKKFLASKDYTTLTNKYGLKKLS
jgi:polar amino acid transport system substrate-binding protein